MEKELIVFEPNMNSNPHSEINAGLISVFEKIFRNTDNFLYGDKRHIRCLEKKKDISNWQIRYVKTFDYRPLFFLINDLFLILKINRILRKHRKKESIFFFLGIMPLAHIYLSLRNKISKRNIIVCLHGQMEAYLPDTTIGLSRKYYMLSKNIFRRNDNLRYIVFGESIKSSIKFLLENEEKILVIDQPYIFNSRISRDLVLRDKIVLGFIGRADKTKNIEELFNLINIIKDDILRGNIVIKIIGKLQYEYPKEYDGLFAFYSKILDQYEFEKELNSIDFALSFTDRNYYRATPSGVFFDCIKWEIPLLSLDNNFISYYSKKYGKIGMIFRNTTEMGNWISEELIQRKFNNQNLVEISQNYKKIKAAISTNSLAEELSRQL